MRRTTCRLRQTPDFGTLSRGVEYVGGSFEGDFLAFSLACVCTHVLGGWGLVVKVCRSVGLCNFDTEHLDQIADRGLGVVSNQVGPMRIGTKTRRSSCSDWVVFRDTAE